MCVLLLAGEDKPQRREDGNCGKGGDEEVRTRENGRACRGKPIDTG